MRHGSLSPWPVFGQVCIFGNACMWCVMCVCTSVCALSVCDCDCVSFFLLFLALARPRLADSLLSDWRFFVFLLIVCLMILHAVALVCCQWLPFVACFSLFLYFFLLHPKTLFVALVVFVVYHFWVNRAEFRAVYWTVKTMGKPSQAAAASTASFQLQLQLRLPRLRSTPTTVPVSRGFCFVSQFFLHFNKFLFLVLFFFSFFVYLSQVLIAKYFIMQSRLTDWLWGLIITIAIN